MTLFTASSFNVFLFVFGLIIGSFLNVVAFRYSGNGPLFNFKKLSGRSRCPYCRRSLKWRELIPLLSFLWQGGRCRSCRHRLSWQYPIVELASGFALLMPYYFYNYFDISHRLLASEAVGRYYIIGVVWTLAALAMILLAAIDSRLRIIPDQINLFLAGLGIILGLAGAGSFLKNYGDWLALTNGQFLDRFLAALAALLFFGFIIMISRGRAMGVGDLKLAGALGLLLGWPDIALSLSFAFVLGAIAGLILLLARRRTLKSIIPFGPFMIAGVFIHIFFGYQIANWYFTFLA